MQLNRRSFRTMTLLLAAAAAPALMVGCLGASDDKQGSGVMGTSGPEYPKAQEIKTQTQADRQDQGAPHTPGTGRVDDGDRTKTGGLGTGSHDIPGKAETLVKPETETPK